MKNKLKVIILHNIISPYRLPLFEELSKKYDLTVYFCKEKTEDRKWSTKLDGYSFKYKILPHKDFGPFVINPTLKKELRENVYDIYILGESPENAFSILNVVKITKRNNKKFILWNEKINNEILSLINFKKSKNLFKKVIYNIINLVYSCYRKKLYSKTNRFISLSEKSTKFLISNNINESKISNTLQIMPESLLLKSTWKSRPLEYKNKKIIFNIGYLNEGKGIDYLIKAFNKLNRKDTLLLIAGTGEEEDKLKNLAKDNKNIIFLGYKEGVEKANYYSIADFFVFPTLHDCWGLVVNEAFYYELPVISTDKAGAIELIDDGKTGFIVPSKNINVLARSMKKLLDNPKLLKQMRENVKKILKSRIVDINTTVSTFDKAIKYALKTKQNNHDPKK